MTHRIYTIERGTAVFKKEVGTFEEAEKTLIEFGKSAHVIANGKIVQTSPYMAKDVKVLLNKIVEEHRHPDPSMTAEQTAAPNAVAAAQPIEPPAPVPATINNIFNAQTSSASALQNIDAELVRLRELYMRVHPEEKELMLELHVHADEKGIIARLEFNCANGRREDLTISGAATLKVVGAAKDAISDEVRSEMQALEARLAVLRKMID